ncbi:MAG: hypothetical protein IPK16_05870 [Anaerolineales bacterium]|nr:hypothetical protein [Anaerolineales bacterium]
MSTSALEIGGRAPSFQLTAIGSGRVISPASNNGAALLLAFHDQNSVDLVQEMQQAVRIQYPDPTHLLAPSLVNMSVVPSPLRPLAESVMKGQYNKAAELMPAGLDVADYVIILCDWDGKVHKAYHAGKVAKQPQLILIDAGGAIRGLYRGRDLRNAALQLLQGLT